jgi:hypothetical protein
VNFQVQDYHYQWFVWARMCRRKLGTFSVYHGWVGLTRVLTPRRSIALLAAVVILVLTGSALAADPGLVDQYVEDIPTAGGTHHSGGSAGPTGSGGSTAGPTTGSATLTPAVEDDLKAAGKDGEKLKEVATSARYGAPATAQAQGGGELGAPSVLGAAASAVGGDDGRIVGLLIALVAITAVAVGVAATGRRRSA